MYVCGESDTVVCELLGGGSFNLPVVVHVDHRCFGRHDFGGDLTESTIMKILAMLIAASFAIVPSTVMAADVYHGSTKDTSSAPVVFSESAEASPWSGVYGGVHAGWNHAEFDHDFRVPDGVFKVVAPGSPVADFGDGAWLFGAQLGAQRQIGNLVFGVEADISWTNVNASQSVTLLHADVESVSVDGNLLTLDHTANVNWLGTLRARVGYPIERFMPYITGGLAVADVDHSVGERWVVDGGSDVLGVRGSLPDDVQLGWTIGGGVDVQLGSGYTLGVEYLYVDLGNSTVRANFDDEVSEFTARTRMDIIKAKLNYQF